MNGHPGSRALTLSIVVLAWNNTALTRRCLESLRSHTIVDHELIVVDNGSDAEGRELARAAADVALLHPTNRGFAAGMNAGLTVARGDAVAFLNNDTVLPPAWDVLLLGHLRSAATGIVVPAVTAAGNLVSVRAEPGSQVRTLPPFRAVPSGVLYLLRTEVARALGGWDERFVLAGAEDADLCFKTWANGLDVVLDERVLVEHVSKASVRQLPDVDLLWASNRRRLLAKWRGPEAGRTLLHDSDAQLVRRRQRQARLIAWGMTLYFASVGRLPLRARRPLVSGLRGVTAALTASLSAVGRRRRG